MDNNELSTNLASVGTDCISKEQAIETFKDCAVNGVGIDGIVGALKQLPPIQPEITHEQAVEYLQSTGWMQEHDRQMMLDGVRKLTIQPKRGKWVLVCDNNGMHFICNKCGAWRYHQEQNFCGDCGADMREDCEKEWVDTRGNYMKIVIDISEYDKEWIGNAYGIPQDINTKIAEAIINAEQCQPEPHWIPVAERLPEENYLDDGYVEPSQPVLVYMSYHTCKISRYWGHRKSKGTSDYVIPDWMDLEEHEGDNVIAWMPLPEAFKG